MNIRAIRDCVFGEVVEADRETRTDSGIIISSTIQGKKSVVFMKVLSIGDGKMFPDQKNTMEFKIKKGDIVLVNEFAGQEIIYMSQRYKMIAYSEIFGVWEDWENVN